MDPARRARGVDEGVAEMARGSIWVVALVHAGDYYTPRVPAFCRLEGEIEWIRMNLSDPIPQGIPSHFHEVGMQIEGVGGASDQNVRVARHLPLDIVESTRRLNESLETALRDSQKLLRALTEEK